MTGPSLFQRRFRGFRVVDLAGLAFLATLVMGVYAFKAHAGGQSAKVAEVNGEILEEQRRIRMLGAELAHLEEPERLEALSTQYLNLAPIAAKHETTPDALMEVARAASDPPKPKTLLTTPPSHPQVEATPAPIASSVLSAPADAPQ